MEHNRLLLTVQDNGAGMSNERLAEMQQLLEAPLASLEASTPGMTGKSYGMLNVQARLRLSFGDEYGIVLESQEGEGTNVTIIHPLMRELPATKQINNEERQESEWENS
ncbi:sensor histidine kinase YesM [Paenibacillus sp. W4I10]|nr:sensor histidine kinase YesM [Paenibacillus sp. W4I10]